MIRSCAKAKFGSVPATPKSIRSCCPEGGKEVRVPRKDQGRCGEGRLAGNKLLSSGCGNRPPLGPMGRGGAWQLALQRRAPCSAAH
jgi:hypothetical protein